MRINNDYCCELCDFVFDDESDSRLNETIFEDFYVCDDCYEEFLDMSEYGLAQKYAYLCMGEYDLDDFETLTLRRMRIAYDDLKHLVKDDIKQQVDAGTKY